MKTLLTFLAFAVCFQAVARGLGKGNGGDMVICTMPDGSETYELLDYYEGKNNTSKEIIIEEQADYIETARWILRKDGEGFLSNAIGFPPLLEGLLELVNRFEEDAVFTDDDLVDIDDHGQVRIASNCKIKQIVIQHADLENDTRQYIIDRKVWDNLSNIEKASLVTHEVIYNKALYLGHTNSEKVRKVNFGLATKDYYLLSDLVKGTDVLSNCRESIQQDYRDWVRYYCSFMHVYHVLKEKDKGYEWEEKFDHIWRVENNIAVSAFLLRYVKGTEETLKVLKKKRFFYSRLLKEYQETNDYKIKHYIIGIFSSLSKKRIPDELFLEVEKELRKLLEVKNSSSHFSSFYSFLIKGVEKSSRINDFLIEQLNKRPIENISAAETFSMVKSLVQSSLQDSSLGPLLANLISDLLTEAKDREKTTLTKTWFILNKKTSDKETIKSLIGAFNRNIPAFLERDKESSNYLYRPDLLVGFQQEIILNVYEKDAVDYNISNLDRVFNPRNLAKIAQGIIKAQDSNIVIDYRLVLDLFINNQSIASSTRVGKKAYRNMIRNLISMTREEFIGGSGISYGINQIIEKTLFKLSCVGKLPGYIASELVAVLNTFAYKYDYGSAEERSLKVLDLLFKVEKLSVEDKLRIRTLGEVDPREAVRKKAAEVYNQL